MTRWTMQQVAALAPDASSLAAARKLARGGPWSDAGSTDTLLWGKCQGSGRTPYQVSVDLTGPAFRCSCPSRKFPCKHALALLMLWVEGAGSVAEATEAAGFAQEWSAERAARAEASASGRAARTAKPPDPEAQARRLEERLALMSAGMDDFALWLADLARNGIASARSQPYSWWDTTAARLVDAQLPGLGDQVRAMASEVSGRPDWPEHLLAAMGRWWTATRAWHARAQLDADEMGDLRAFIGWPVPSETVREADSLTDHWTVLGAHRTDDGRLQQQRTWLRGESCGETVQVLDFAAGGQVLPTARVVGSVLGATLARYPGRAVRRATFVDEPVLLDAPGVLRTATDVPGTDGSDGQVCATHGAVAPADAIAAADGIAAAVWALNPWARRVPVVLPSVSATVVHGEARPADGTARSGRKAAAEPHAVAAALVDSTGHGRLLTTDTDVWRLLALTGGHPVDVFAELESGRLRALSVSIGPEVVTV